MLASYAQFPVLVGVDGSVRWAHFRTQRYTRPGEIVLHYTAGGVFENDVYYITKENERKISVHFVVAQDGRVLLVCPLDYTANHAGVWARNVSSIGIELCHPNDDAPYPEPQLAATVELCKTLCALFDIPVASIIGHREIVPTVCPRALDLDMVRAWVAGDQPQPEPQPKSSPIPISDSILKTNSE